MCRRFATTTTDYVGPGQVGWFVYTVQAPLDAPPGDYRFGGDLGETKDPNDGEGYSQVATEGAN